MRDEIEAGIADILADVLDTTTADVFARPELAEHSWDSRAALEVLAQLESRFGVTVDFRVYHAVSAVADLVAIVTESLSGKEVSHPAQDRVADERAARRRRYAELAREPRPGDLRVALLATFTVDPLAPYLGTALAGAGIRARLWVGPYHQIERQCLDESATARFAPEVLVVVPRFEELWAGRHLPLADPATEYAADPRHLARACVTAARRWRSELIFVLPALPEARPAGVGDDGNPRGVVATAARVRESLRQDLAGRDGVTLVDAEVLVRALGSEHVRRPTLSAAGIPFSEEFFDLLARRVCRVIELRRAPGPLLVVLDAETVARGGVPFGNYLAEVSRLGASFALCDASERSRDRLAEFVPVAAWRAAGSPPATQIRELAADLSAGRVVLVTAAESIVDSAGCELPLRTVALPGDPERWVQIVSESGALDQLPPAGRDGDEVADTATLTLDGFLKSLRLSVDCAPLSAEAAADAADLTRRAAEFHLTGAVWPVERFTESGATGLCWGISVRDRFGDYGRSGVVAAHADGDALVVDLWVLTCPVLGKGVEERVLHELTAHARSLGLATVRFGFRRTARNDAMRDFLSANGFAVPAGGKADARPAVPAPRLTTAAGIVEAVESRAREQDSPEDSADGPGRPPRTDLEQVLAGVFADVLRRPSIGVDRDFFAAGGDSMLAVTLIAKANQAGVRLTLRQVFQHHAVAELAAVATWITSAAGETGETGEPPASGPAPLFPLQEWFFGLDLPNRRHFNQSQRFTLDSDVDVPALSRAVAVLLAHHQALRTRFVRTEAGWRQTDPGAPKQPPFRHIELGGTPVARWETALVAHETTLQLAMSPTEGRLVQVALFTFGAAAPPRLLVILHHLAIDGISWRILLADLQEAYHQACAGGEVRLPEVGVPAHAWARRLAEYARSDEVRAELPRWLCEERVIVQPVPMDHPESDDAGTLTDVVTEVLDAAGTAALLDSAIGVHRVPVDVLLLAAATRTLATTTGARRLLIDVVNHGREPFLDGVDLSRTVAWLVVNVPVLFEVGDVAEPAELVATVSRQLQEWSSHHGAGDTLLRYLSDDESVRHRLAGLPAADVLFSYAGRVEQGSARHPLLGHTIAGSVPDLDPGATMPYALQFDAMIVDGRLRMEIAYRAAQYRESTVDKLLTGWTSLLRELTASTPRPRGARP